MLEEFKSKYQEQLLSIDTLEQNLRKETEKRTVLHDHYQKKIVELQAEIRSLKNVLNRQQEMRSAAVLHEQEEYDGKILKVDIPRRFAIVDLGKVDKVRRGMRFEVKRKHLGEWSKPLATLEISKVGVTTSTAIILDEVVAYGKCPLCGYLAKEQEKFCPYCAQGNDSNEVVPIPSTHEVLHAGMNQLNPIVEGDFVTNKAYSRNRVLKFVVVGEPVRYHRSQIAEMIRLSGGEVQEDVEVDTDYIVLGRIPREDDVGKRPGERGTDKASREAAKAAKDRFQKSKDMLEAAERYGVPRIREMELRRLLQQ